METKEGRKNYIDNIRWMTVVLVMIYHVIYIFNSQGVLSNFGVQGIAQVDGFLYIVYPWFMVLLFIVAGISAKYALVKRTGKEFAKDRAKRLLIPSIGVMFFAGWISGFVTNYYSDMFMGAGNQIPGFVKYLIYCVCGTGPMWFARELFLASMVLLLIRAIDKKDRLGSFCSRIKWWGFILLFFSLWGSSMILNTPMIEVYRNGIYINAFLMGYYIFSQDKVIEGLSRVKKFLLPLFLLAAAGYYAYIRIVIEPQATDNILTSVNYCSMSVLKNFYTNAYAWIAVLAIFSAAKDLLSFENRFTRYMSKANFGYYAFHYPCLSAVGFLTLEVCHLPIWACYIVNFFGMIILTTVLYLVVSKIPVLRALTLGIYRDKKKA